MAPPAATALVLAAAARLARAGLPNPELDAETLFRGLSGQSRAGFLAGSADPVAEEVEAAFERAVARRERQEPVQYILGSVAFWRDEFRVNRAVLIPRPDTEILVEAVALRLRAFDGPRILDLGTGSGAIALSLLRELPGSTALAIDASADALGVAQENAALLGLADRIELRLSRWFSDIRASEIFDAIVSNPPYIAAADAAALAPEVRDFEPSMALFADTADDLSSYRAILDEMPGHLRSGGLLAFEVGMGQAERVATLMEGRGLKSLETLEDLAGILRVILGRLH